MLGYRCSGLSKDEKLYLIELELLIYALRLVRFQILQELVKSISVTPEVRDGTVRAVRECNVGALVGDSFLGRYRTIVVAFVVDSFTVATRIHRMLKLDHIKGPTLSQVVYCILQRSKIILIKDQGSVRDLNTWMNWPLVITKRIFFQAINHFQLIKENSSWFD
ncbi:hypothetical protein Droror1_Dr00021590 [Drosera rotundifolia]